MKVKSTAFAGLMLLGICDGTLGAPSIATTILEHGRDAAFLRWRFEVLCSESVSKQEGSGDWIYFIDFKWKQPDLAFPPNELDEETHVSGVVYLTSSGEITGTRTLQSKKSRGTVAIMRCPGFKEIQN